MIRAGEAGVYLDPVHNWDPSEPARFDERANRELLLALLREPQVLLEALAPQGWTHSPLGRLSHSTGDAVPDPEREVVELLGMALWDVFSHGNSVVDAEGTVHDLGSFRGAAGFIAEVFEERYPALERRDYLDFYMGTTLIARRADLRPLYRWIFDRLRAAGRDWRFVLPRLHVIRLPDIEDSGFESYDPSMAVHAEFEPGQREEELRAFMEELGRLNDEAVERARREPPPATVTAYRDAYGELPEGWPPE